MHLLLAVAAAVAVRLVTLLTLVLVEVAEVAVVVEAVVVPALFPAAAAAAASGALFPLPPPLLLVERVIIDDLSSLEVVAEEEEALLLPLHNCRRIKHIMRRDQMEAGKHLELIDRIADMEAQIRPLSPSLDLWSVYNASEPIVNYLHRGLTPPCSPELAQFLDLVHNHVHFNLYYGEKQQIKLGVSPLLLEIVGRFKGLAAGEEVAPVSLYVGEDVSLVPFLRSFEIQEVPTPGSFLQIEFHSYDNDFYLHFLFNGNPISLSKCAHPCSLSSFEQAWERRMYKTAEKWAEKCDRLNAERPWPWKKISIYCFAFVGIVLFMKLKEKIMAKFVQMFKKKVD